MNQENFISVDVKQRNVSLGIFLSIVTFGIYFLYWYAKVSKETAKIVGEETHRGGALTPLFHLITCGLFSAYWFYKVPHKLNELRASVGLKAQSLSKSVWLFCLWADAQLASFLVFGSMLRDEEILAEINSIDFNSDSGVFVFVFILFLLAVCAWVLTVFVYSIVMTFAYFTLDSKPQANYAILALFSAPLAVAFLQKNLNNYLTYLDRKNKGFFSANTEVAENA